MIRKNRVENKTRLNIHEIITAVMSLYLPTILFYVYNIIMVILADEHRILKYYI